MKLENRERALSMYAIRAFGLTFGIFNIQPENPITRDIANYLKSIAACELILLNSFLNLIKKMSQWKSYLERKKCHVVCAGKKNDSEFYILIGIFL